MPLSGANGKTTLLQVLAGKTMVPTEDVRVIGRPPFHDTELTCSATSRTSERSGVATWAAPGPFLWQVTSARVR